jgi:hypothetical protein
MSKFTGLNSALSPIPSKPLSRMRFFWNVGKAAKHIPSNKIPKDFPEMEEVLDDWGNSLLNTMLTAS